PSASVDVHGILGRFIPSGSAGFYYRMFTGPRLLNTLFLKVVHRLTGMGSFPSAELHPPNQPVRNKKMDTEVAVVGGGPAGLSAAIHAAKLGCKVTIIDENNRLGGQLVKQTHKFFGSREHYAAIRGINIGKILADEAIRSENIVTLENASAVGLYKGNVLGVVQDNDFITLQAKKVIVSTGAYERTHIFENNDLPGIMGAGGVQTMMNVYGIRPGNEALMVGAGNVGLIISYQLLQAGVDVEGVVEAAPNIGGYTVHASKIRRMGVPIYTSHTIKRAWGGNRVKGATIIALDKNWGEIPGTEKNITCDLICVATGLKPTYELLYQVGCKMEFIPELGGHTPLRTRNMETTIKGVYISGDAAGIEEASTAIVGGRIAGISAALGLGYGGKEAEGLREKSIEELEMLRSGPTSARIRSGLEKVLVEAR
ncbi:MAG: NAD(P)/FAD-dependent oxidoreductase, partial [Thermodesulfobacteriota bacterium]